MEVLQLKYNIIQKITQLDNLQTLEKVRDYIHSLQTKANEGFALENNKNADFNHKEDFTDYIKEWVKEM